MQNFITILVLDNDIEAQLLDSILTERNIPHIMRTYHDSAYDGIYQMSKGWGHVEAPDDCRNEILAAYDELKNSITQSDAYSDIVANKDEEEE